MIKYFVVSDIHGFYDIFINSLTEKGFDINNSDHKVIICGDIFDRGNQAKELLYFLLELQKYNRLILVKGNHEDLLEDCYDQLEAEVNISHHHWRNGTLDTIAQLTDTNKYDLVSGLYNFKNIKKQLKPYFELISNAVNYYELKDYVFVHGWIPPRTEDIYYKYDPNWRNASTQE
jgi:serine/threonine protein phosphatase 1